MLLRRREPLVAKAIPQSAQASALAEDRRDECGDALRYDLAQTRVTAAPLTGRAAVRALSALALLAPFATTAFLSSAAITHAASSAGPALAQAARVVAPSPRERPADGFDLESALGVSTATPEPLPPIRQDRTRRPSPPKARGILVRAATVRRAIRMGGRPSGSPTPASGARPAGLVLHGISRYGSALRDGDVLTSIGGTRATTSTVVVGAVIGAVRAGSHAISGVVWRGQERFTVTVELPKS